MLALKFVGDDGFVPDSQTTTRIAAACHARALLVLVCGTFGNVIRLLPPLVIEEQLLREGMEILAEEIERVS